MQVIRLYALRSERKALLEQLQRLGAVEITDSLELDGAIPEGFTRIDREEEAGTFDRMAASARQALEILDEYAPAKKGMLAPFPDGAEVSEQEFSACAEKSREVMAVCNEVQALRKRRRRERQNWYASVPRRRSWSRGCRWMCRCGLPER